MAKRRRSIYRAQADATAALAASPERRGLLQLMLEAQATRDQGIHAARTSGKIQRTAIRRADPAVQKVYADARAGLTAQTGDYAHPAAGIAHDFSQLGPAAGSIAEAARAEADASQRRNTEAETASRVGLQDQRTQSAAGETFAVRAAGDKYSSDVGKIASQLLGVDQEQGLRAATELGRLTDAAAGRSTTRRGQTLSHQDRVADRSSRETIAAQRKTAAKKKDRWAPRAEQHAAGKDFGAAKGGVQTLKAEGFSRSEIAHLLLAGRAKTKLSSGRELPSVKAVTDEDLVSAALDEAFGGHLGRRTQRRLHKRGIRVSPLGVVTYGQFRKRQRAALPPYHPSPLAPGADGQNRPT